MTNESMERGRDGFLEAEGEGEVLEGRGGGGGSRKPLKKTVGKLWA